MSSLSESLKKACQVNEYHLDPIVKVDRLSYMRFSRKDLDKAIQFFENFGLQLSSRNEDLAYLRGKDCHTYAVIVEKSEQPLSIIGLSVNSMEELELLAQRFSLAINERQDGLGGYFVLLHDPENNPIEVNYGLKRLPQLHSYAFSSEHNFKANVLDKTPRINQMVRPELMPSPVLKIGHTVLGVKNIKSTIHWYQETLGFMVSDFQMLTGETLPSVAFMRCDKGETASDHHTLAIASALDKGHLHTAFEVADIDKIAMGQAWLKEKGYRHSWGIGRHILGSQIFDYWRDPWGYQFEHYCDGDVFNDTVDTGYSLFSAQSIHQWGPDINKDMLGNKLSLSLLYRVFKDLFSSADLSVKRLMKLIKAT